MSHVNFLPLFLTGYDDPDGKNPYLLTSDSSDAWVLGRYFKRNGVHRPTDKSQLRKSRGYSWVICGVKYTVDGEEITITNPAF